MFSKENSGKYSYKPWHPRSLAPFGTRANMIWTTTWDETWVRETTDHPEIQGTQKSLTKREVFIHNRHLVGWLENKTWCWEELDRSRNIAGNPMVLWQPRRTCSENSNEDQPLRGESKLWGTGKLGVKVRRGPNTWWEEEQIERSQNIERSKFLKHSLEWTK